jgi:hypothetical protein
VTPAELLARYPYDPAITPQDCKRGTPEMLRLVPDGHGYREALASLFLVLERRWVVEETERRAQELRRQHQPLKAQSREHVDGVWPYGDKP